MEEGRAADRCQRRSEDASVDRFVDLDGVRCELAPFYSVIGRPSIDPELNI
jgi:hypothetical protein